jgi:multicomponent Na+:H+ antiporter subunit D
VHLFASAYLLCLTGLVGIAITGDLFNVFVFLEISSLASYTLVSIGTHRRALHAAFTYLVLGTIGGTFILIGIGLVYQATGTLNMADIAARLPAVRHLRSVPTAFAFLTIGTGIKLAIFPLGQWLPNAYTFAPPAVSAFLAGTSTKVIYYLLVRIIFTMFGPTYVFQTLHFGDLMLPLSVAAMFVGSIAAVYQKNVKRLLAYSSVAQIGYLTLALSLGTASALAAGLLHLVNHALMKSGLFLVVSCISSRTGSDSIDSLAGLGRRMPITTGAFVVGGLGLVGVPATVGFVSKWYLVLAALEIGAVFLAFVILVSSLIAAIYVWRIVEIAYFRAPAPGQSTVHEAPLGILLPTCVVIGATVYFGLFSNVPVTIAAGAAEQLFQRAPR